MQKRIAIVEHESQTHWSAAREKYSGKYAVRIIGRSAGLDGQRRHHPRSHSQILNIFDTRMS